MTANKPCPFCGFDKTIVKEWGGSDMCMVVCRRCGAQGPEAKRDTKVKNEPLTSEHYALAYAKWNERARG